jgi:selenium-binding protein 1
MGILYPPIPMVSFHSFVSAALSSTIIRFYKDGEKWKAEPVIREESYEVEGWLLPTMPSIIPDLVISLDDKYLYYSNWVHGDIKQYDIRQNVALSLEFLTNFSDPSSPKLVGQVYV